MSYRLATPEDRDALAAYLDAHLAQAMFPRANLEEFGFEGTHPYACQFWIKTQGPRVISVLARANSGMVMPCMPVEDAPELARLLKGQTIGAMTGPKPQIDALQLAFGISNSAIATRTDEPQFHLSLSQLRLPDGPGQIIPFAQASREVLLDWVSSYLCEVGRLSPAAARHEARATLERNLSQARHVVLMEGSQPLSMCGLNARVGTMGQVGGVYTPPNLRGLGHARRAVALHLAQLGAQGLSDAVLYAARPAASRTYRAIGFREIGAWRYFALKSPQVIA